MNSSSVHITYFDLIVAGNAAKQDIVEMQFKDKDSQV